MPSRECNAFLFFSGKELLATLLASGEINVLDRKIVEKVKSGECDPSILNVLQVPFSLSRARARFPRSRATILCCESANPPPCSTSCR